MDFHLFLSSLDSETIHSTNQRTDFTVELPQPINLKGSWECALLDFQLTGATIPNDPFYLCSDICEDSSVGDVRLPVLRRLSAKGRKKDSEIQFQHPLYMRVRLDHIPRIRLFIRPEHHSDEADRSGQLTCTLHFKKTT
jgi:hypothetical protein